MARQQINDYVGFLFAQTGVPGGIFPYQDGTYVSVPFTPSGLSDQTGFISDLADVGEYNTARPYIYEWEARVALAGSGTVGKTIDIYLATSGQLSNYPGVPHTTFRQGERRYNLQYLGSIVNDGADGSGNMIARGTFKYYGYEDIAILWWNNSGQQILHSSGHFIMVRQKLYEF